jgi:hypothetical protein
MSSTGSNGPVNSISSIRQETGSNTDDTLQLGRMLADQFDDHDIVGQWMAHQLAELVQAAQDDATATVEQRQQIVETILKVWSHRSDYPRPAPLEEFDSVIAALDRLGDDSPWRFSRLFDLMAEAPEPGTSSVALVTTAAEFERLARETLLHLIWLAAYDAKERNRDWLEVADKIASNVESDVTTALERLQRRVALRRSVTAGGSTKDAAETTAKDVDALGKSEGTVEATADGLVGNGTDDSAAELFDDDDTSDLLSNINHVKLLREMADLLNKIADALCTGPELGNDGKHRSGDGA